jgi:hypothetical protein
MLSKLLYNKRYRLCACALLITLIAFTAVWVGGILLHAFVLVAALYVGVMVTLSRIPDKVPSNRNVVVRSTLAPIVATRNLLMRFPLITTIIMSVLVGTTIGFSTVTGITAIAISAVMGDLIIRSFCDVIDIVNDKRRVPTTEEVLQVI